MNRPQRLVGVIGTHTEVGKTWVLCQLVARARSHGVRVAARKPVQSYAPDDVTTDAERLAQASGEAAEQICPPHRWYPVPMAPPMATEVLGRGRLTFEQLAAELTWPEAIELGFIETVGGGRSPVTHDADSIDLLTRVGVDEWLLVADAGLGTINGVRLTLAAVPSDRVTVILNRFETHNTLHRLNYEWLRDREQINVLMRWEDWR